jgi:hypothetical protein
MSSRTYVCEYESLSEPLYQDMDVSLADVAEENGHYGGDPGTFA